MTLDQIRTALQDRNLAIVAKGSGVHVNTLWRIRSGQATNATLRTVERIRKYLQATYQGVC